MRFNKLEIDPSKNPAILDTATWDPGQAWRSLQSLNATYWSLLKTAGLEGQPLPTTGKFKPYPGSCTSWRDSLYLLGELADGQQVLVELGAGQGEAILGKALGKVSLPVDYQIAIYRTELDAVANFVRIIHPHKGPRVMGAVPRLGIGNRTTTAAWPVIYRAMHRGDFAANAIQNSMRELNVLDDLLTGRPAEQNYGPNFGTIESGHTGSSFEGLWLYGVLEALKADTLPRYGADADHMQVKRGTDHISRAKRALNAARHYTFYTMDVSDILDYQALTASPALAEDRLAQKIPDPTQRTAVLAYHRQPLRVGGTSYVADETTTGRLVGKYWDGLNAMQELVDHLRQIKDGQPFDLEFAIDEAPPGVPACDAITTDAELVFVIREAWRRELPLTHVACNFGIEKEFDYRCPDGLPGLEARVQVQSQIAAESDIMLDFHSGDDLSRDTRCAIGRATQGQNHFKISPSLQLLFAEVLSEIHPRRFHAWWDATLAYARREAEAGSPLAVECLRAFESGGDQRPGAHHRVFHHYGFAFVGRRDARGQFLHRESLYGLSPIFYDEYSSSVEGFLCQIAEELFQPRETGGK